MKLNFDPEMTTFYDIKSLEEAEALVTSYPSSSKAWICYMVYALKLGEIAKARSLARRGLQSINFRDDQERLNIWFALLNTECRYGSSNTLNSVLQEALQYNDQEKIYNHMLDLYISLRNTDNALSLYELF